MTKAHRLHSPTSHTTYASPLKLVYSDLWGTSHYASNLSFKYYISFVDSFSKFIYPLKTKSKALTIFKKFKTMIELQHGLPIKALQSDWGGELIPFTTFLIEHGILHRVICPHIHHQNGVIERKHMHIVEIGLTLISQASLPFTYWDYAFSSAIYLINIIPYASINFQVSFKVFFIVNPDYKFLKVFRCVCFPLLRPYHTHKLDFRSQECIFLGYYTSHKGYKCLSPSGRIYISKYILFNEIRFL